MQSPSNIRGRFQQLRRGRSTRTQEAAADSLADLALEPGGATAILQSGADLSLLAARVGNGRSYLVRVHALQVLTSVAVPVEGRPAVVAAGGVAAAVEALRTSTRPSMLLRAAGLLRTLAHDTDERVPAMVDAGAFAALTDVLRRSSNGAVLVEVGSALCNATTAGGRNAISAAAAAACLAAGAHIELLRHLSSDGLSAEAKDALLGATRALCNHAAGKAAVVQAGGLDVLALCLADGSPAVQEEAAAAFINLAYSGGAGHCSNEVADHPQALAALAALLRSPEHTVRSTAGEAIGNIIWNSPGSSATLAASGALAGMVHLLQHSSGAEQMYAVASALAVLAARGPDARDAAVAAGAVPALQRLCDSANPAVREAAAEALEKLDAGSEGSEYESAEEE